jgi:hypothetical protein
MYLLVFNQVVSYMKKLFIYFMASFVMLFPLVVMFSCSDTILTSENVGLHYKLTPSKTGYVVTDSNIAGVTSTDRWELVDVEIPATYRGLPVVAISRDAFKDCAILRSVSIPDSVTTISGSAFYNCSALESVHIPKSVVRLYGHAFARTSSLKAVTVDPDNTAFCSIDGNVYTKDGQTLILYAGGNPQSVFEIPSGVSTIEHFAIFCCDYLETIVIPDTLTEIDYSSIVYCNALRGVQVNESNPRYQSIDGNLYSKDGKTFLRFYHGYPNAVLEIPEGVTAIADLAASDCRNLISVVFPDSLTSIGAHAFLQTALLRISIPENVTFIGEGAFYRCNQLREAEFVNADGWRAVPVSVKFGKTIELKPSELELPNRVATYLIDTYTDYEWHRIDQ